MPFRDGFFDKTFCIGVLQHTPDVKKAFDSLVKKVRSNGILVIDVYKKVPLYKNGFILNILYEWLQSILII